MASKQLACPDLATSAHRPQSPKHPNKTQRPFPLAPPLLQLPSLPHSADGVAAAARGPQYSPQDESAGEDRAAMGRCGGMSGCRVAALVTAVLAACLGVAMLAGGYNALFDAAFKSVSLGSMLACLSRSIFWGRGRLLSCFWEYSVWCPVGEMVWVAVVSVAGYGWRWITKHSFLAGLLSEGACAWGKVICCWRLFYLALLCMWTKGCEVHFVQKESSHFYLYVLVAIITVLQIRVGNYISVSIVNKVLPFAKAY